MFFRRRNPDDTLTPSQRERLLIVMVSGADNTERRRLTEHRLLFARDLVEHGRIGHDPDEARDDR